MNVLIVLTSHGQLGDTGEKTGFWLEELAAPYLVFASAGADITLASPKGGEPPLDPRSDNPEDQSEAVALFKSNAKAVADLASTKPLDGVNLETFDAIFYPGGHGPLWDLAENKASIALLEKAAKAELPIAAVCHGPGVFRHVSGKNGKPLVAGKAVTGFSNSEEEAVGLSGVVPFSVEDMLKEQGGQYSKGDDWAPYVQSDSQLVTGQNPASSADTAKALLSIMAKA
ncbi:type 1 glutamine amidotransferase domain-containing protein [Gallaecimonas mangrovi]|uniref:type 1 glutamine amidotransferase domain-containing protein n=1 Tax=Gallaecimonas mangrovi TaxID=2291597 RepID=UPI000E207E3C|nr:type 1 glutamine amidotransferase domain-containing protein [Gallaecimonas mangrovi]